MNAVESGHRFAQMIVRRPVSRCLPIQKIHIGTVFVAMPCLSGLQPRTVVSPSHSIDLQDFASIALLSTQHLLPTGSALSTEAKILYLPRHTAVIIHGRLL